MANSDCKFICAATPSVRNHIITAKTEDPQFFDDSSINNFINNNVNKFLTSYGIALQQGKKITPKINDRYKLIFDKTMNQAFFKNIEITVDSGGFQVQMGYIHKDETSNMIKFYHEFLEEYKDKYNYAFVLDLAPGASECIYDSWKEMEKYNYKSYTKSAETSPDVLSKMVYIHHFRTPKINELWRKMLFQDRLGDSFSNFATGGLVSFSSTNAASIVLYSIPLIEVLVYARQRGLRKFRFHVLGASEWKDIIFHKFVQKHVKEKFEIDLEVTYDSSSIFQMLAMARDTVVADWNTGVLHRVSIKSNNLSNFDHRFNMTAEDVFYKAANDATVTYGMNKIDKINKPIYENTGIVNNNNFSDNDTGRLSRTIYVYGIFQLLHLYSEVDKYCTEIAEKLYPLYRSDKIEFIRELTTVVSKFNYGKLNKNAKNRSVCITNSLDDITQLDLDKCRNYVTTYLAEDESDSMFNSHKNLTF